MGRVQARPVGKPFSPCFVLLFFLAPACPAQPMVMVPDRVLELGLIDPEEHPVIHHTFEVINAGTEDLVIRDIQTSCGCTLAVLSATRLAPAEIALLETELRPAGKEGPSRIRISLVSNDPDRPIYDLGLSGTFLRRWRLEPPVLENLRVVSGHPYESLLTVYSESKLTEETLTITEIVSASDLVTATEISAATERVEDLYQRGKQVFRVVLLDNSEPGTKGHTGLRLETSGGPINELGVGVYWDVMDDLTFDPIVMRAGEGSAATGVMEIRSRSGQKLNGQIVAVTGPFVCGTIEGNGTSHLRWEVRWQPEMAGPPADTTSGLVQVVLDEQPDQVLKIPVMVEQETLRPQLWLDQQVLHIGTVLKGEYPRNEETFVLGNIGKTDLSGSVRALHSRITAVPETFSLPPEATTEVRLALDLSTFSGPLEEQVLLTSNAPDTPTTVLTLRGEIIEPWSADPPQLNLSNVTPGTVEQRVVELAVVRPDWQEPVALAEAGTQGNLNWQVLGVVQEHKPLGFITTQVRLRIGVEVGEDWGWQTDRLQLPVLEAPVVPVCWCREGTIRVRPEPVRLEPPDGPDDTVTRRVQFKHVAGREFSLTVDPTSKVAGLSWQLVSDHPSEKWIEVSADGIEPGYYPLEFETGNSDQPVVCVLVEVVETGRED